MRDYLATACGGDVRKAINGAELLCAAGQQVDGVVTVTLEDAELVGQKSAFRYDRDGDNHYDILSALQKSIRGSDPDAGLHYLARLLEAGDLVSGLPAAHGHCIRGCGVGLSSSGVHCEILH